MFVTICFVSGLYNDSLQHQKALTGETVELINAFLNHLNKPVCLLAHNGNRFDFPLLVTELKRINQSLNSLLLCADTLEAFRSLDGLPAKYIPSANQTTGQKYQNSPMTGNVTPSKSKTSSTQSPLKRKGTNELNVLTNQSPKVNKQHLAQIDIHNDTKSTEKVKKKLVFESKEDVEKEKVETHSEKKTKGYIENKDSDIKNTNSAIENKNIITKNTPSAIKNEEDIVEEFSTSLTDDDYLLALDNVEKELCEEKLAFEATKESINEVTEKDSKINCEVSKNNSTTAVNLATLYTAAVEPSSVANGTGYFIKSTHAQSKLNNITTGFQESNGDRSISNIDIAANPANIPVSHDNRVASPMQQSSSPLSRHENLTVGVIKSLGRYTNTCLPVTKVNLTTGHSNSPVSFHVTSRPFNQCLPVHTTTSDNLHAIEASRNSSPKSSVPSSMASVSPLVSASVTVSRSVTPSVTSFLASVTNSSSDFNKLADTTNLSSSKSTAISVVSSSPRVLLSGSAPSSASKIPIATPTTSSPIVPRKSYKLEEVFLRKFGSKPLESHKAEDDCIALVKVAKCTPEFINCVDSNSVLFTSISAPF